MKELTCINCPMGCHLMVDDTDPNNIIVSGNTCARGTTYGKNEVTHPLRMVTSVVKVKGGDINTVSVKTKEAIPKELMFKSLELLKNIELEAPVSIGDVIVPDILGTKVPFIATKNIKRV